MRVLLVEDDRDLRILLAEELGPASLLIAASGEDALDLLHAVHEVAAVVTDLDLGPGPTGIDVLRMARARNPGCARVLVTAHSNGFLGPEATALVDVVFGKPWVRGSIAAYLRARVA